MQSAALATRKSLEEAKFKLKDLKTEYPLNIEAIVETQLEIRDYEDGLKIIKGLQEEFGFIN